MKSLIVDDNVSLERQKFFNNFLDLINKLDKCFVLRKFDLLRSSTVKDDVDLLISKDDLSALKKFFKGNGFSYYYDSHLTNVFLYGAQPHLHFINKSLDLHFDCVTGLIHQSLHVDYKANTRITYWLPLDQLIQDQAFSSNEYFNDLFGKIPILIPEVELVHILSHIILDKAGIFTEYYRSRVIKLMSVVDRDKVLILFDKVFFSFSCELMSLLDSKIFDNLYARYVSFSRY